MDTHGITERLDRAIGEPTVRADLDSILATGRRQRRRRSSAIGALAFAVVAATGGGAWWAARSGQDTPREAADLTVAVTTCTPQQLSRVPEDQDVLWLLTGRGSMCLVKGAEPLERIDTPIPGKRSVALKLRDPASTDMVAASLLIVWGGYGLGEDYPVAQVDFDWDAALTGDPASSTNGVPHRSLSTFVAAMVKQGVAEPQGRTEGWSHCPGAKEPLVQTGDEVCVGQGYEVLDRAEAAGLREKYLDRMRGVLDAEDMAQLRASLPTPAGAMVWELVDRQGNFRYLTTGTERPAGMSDSTPIRMPMELAVGMLGGAQSSTEAGSESLAGDHASSEELPTDLLSEATR